MLKLNLQYFGHQMPRADSVKKTLMLGKLRQKEKGMRCLDDTTDSMDRGLSKLREMVKGKEAWHSVVHGVAEIQT